MSERNALERFERYAVPFFALLLFLIATQVALANLPANKLFAGHDSGFYTLFPDQLIRTSAGTWEVKTALGFVNFQALVTLPLALLVLLVNALHLSGATVGRFFYELQLLVCEFGTFFIAWLILERFYGSVRPLMRALAAFIAALVATFNIFTAVLLLYPPSNFQMGVFVWPVVIACELYLLWRRPTVSVAMLFGIVLTLATLGNPAHTMLGFALVAGVYIANSIGAKNWRWPLLATVALVTFATSIFFWLPAFASIFLYHGNVSAPVGANASALTSSAELIKLRTTIAALLRFDGLLWWPKTPNADLYNSALMIFATYVPAALALIALFSKRWISRALWVLLLVGIELGKSAHPPFQLNLVALMTSVPLFAAFRQTYDKFALYIMLALPPLAAIGLVVLSLQRRYLWATVVAIGFVVVGIWPFLAGRVADPYFLTNIPADYRRVDAIMGNDPQARALSLPGGSNEIHVTDWFKGGNFENLLFRTRAVNGAIFKQRAISAAPLYDDQDLVAADELPELIGLLGIYDIKYVLLHKDYLTSYRMAFDVERYRVLGPLLARAQKRYLDSDPRLRKVYDGASLALYEVRATQTLPHAFASYQAATALGYENVLLGLADAGIMDAAHHPNVLFVGNQVVPDGGAGALDTLMRSSAYVVRIPLIPETPALYREQVSLDIGTAQTQAQQYSQLDKPSYLVFVQPHGDWLKGNASTSDNLVGTFFLNRPQVSEAAVIVKAARAPREAFADFQGLEGDRPWTLSSYAAQLPASATITEADLADPEATPAPNEREPFLDPSEAQLPTQDVPATITMDRSSVTYVIRPQHGGELLELTVASRPISPIAMLSDPRLTFDYELSDPQLLAAWLRFEFLDPSGRRVYLDKQLDATGYLEDFHIRDTLQAGLDRRFNKLSALHQSDPLWAASQPNFNPPQADDFQLVGLHLILSKAPGSDFSLHMIPGKLPGADFPYTPGSLAFRFRGLQITLHDAQPPAYANVAYRADFASPNVTTRSRSISEMSVVRKSGATFVNASPIIGRTDASVSFRLALPAVDLHRYPRLVLRYWQPASNEDLVVKLGLLAAGRLQEVDAGLELPSDLTSDDAVPARWIGDSSFPEQSVPIGLDAQPDFAQSSGDWKKLTFDLRRIAAYRAATLHPKLRYVSVEFRSKAPPQPPPPEGTVGDLSGLVFGLGDLALEGSTAHLQMRAANVLQIDGKPQRQRSVTRIAGAADQLMLQYPTIDLTRGLHRVTTRLQPPWMVGSVAIAPKNVPRSAAPPLTIRHIDDELFAVHVDRNRPVWISFAETYHAGWRLVAATAPKNRLQWAASLRWLRAPAGEHVMGNAYNNTWFVTGAGPGDYVIDFAPQDFAVIGKVLALLATLVALGLAAYWWRR
ncbi:MAG: hypothetical protein JO024_01075 [Candidatus Eremiobacteraeota bacterium]|nr:hypothetical protein [Candidatus Eremiobacteraeota bacterium]